MSTQCVLFAAEFYCNVSKSEISAKRFLGRTILEVAHNGNTSAVALRAQDAAVASETPPASREFTKRIDMDWGIRRKFSTYIQLFFDLILCRRDCGELLSNRLRLQLYRQLRDPADSKQTHVARWSSPTGVPADAGRLACAGIFLTRFAVRCPFVRGIDMHKTVLESHKFSNSFILTYLL